MGLLERDRLDLRREDIAATSTTDEHQREHELQSVAAKMKDRNLYDGQLQLIVQGPADQARVASQRLSDLAGMFGGFAERQAHICVARGTRPPWCLLCTKELATLWHLPTRNTGTAGMAQAGVPEYEPPVDLPLPERIAPEQRDQFTLLGESVYRGHFEPFGMFLPDRRLHSAFIGKSGMGKTTLLKSTILSDIMAGRGVIIIDPHGDMIDELLPRLPKHRQRDVVLFDVTNTKQPLSYNRLDCRDSGRAHRIAADMVATFAKLHDEFWRPQSGHVLFNALMVLMSVEGTSLVSVEDFLGNADYRGDILLKAPASRAKTYWLESFAAKPRRQL